MSASIASFPRHSRSFNRYSTDPVLQTVIGLASWKQKQNTMPKVPRAKSKTYTSVVPQARWMSGSSSKSAKTQTRGRKLILDLKGQFEANANPTQAIPMKKYLRNQFEFYGLKAPEHRAIAKRVTVKYLNPDVEMVREVLALAWLEEKREFQMFAVDYAIKHRGILAGDTSDVCLASTDCIKSLLTTKSWWDTVDMLASNVVGYFASMYPDSLIPVMDEWVDSEKMWLRRTAIIHQLNYKDKTDQELLFKYCLQCCHEREFFIEKAIGWALRTYFRVSPAEVKKFVKKNEGKTLPS